mgnify:CR=1 FL=1
MTEHLTKLPSLFEDSKGVLEQSQENFAQKQSLDNCKTFKKWGIEMVSGKLCENWDQVKIEWQKEVTKPGADVIVERGQILLGEFLSSVFLGA